MSLSTLLDIVWTELWDDISPMGDRSRYHKILIELFVEGKDPYDITWKDHDGKLQRLSNQRGGTTDGKPTATATSQAQEWLAVLKNKRDSLVESPDDAE